MSDPSPDLTLITATDHSAASHPAWPAFLRLMAARGTLRVDLADAWTWFRDGWDAKIAQLKVQATDEWCDTW